MTGRGGAIEILRTVLRLFALGRPHWRLLALAFACMAVLGATSGAYAHLMGPALKFLLTGGEDGLSAASRLFPFLRGLDRSRALLAFPALVVAIGVAKGAAYFGQFYWMGLYGQRVVTDLRRRLFARVTSLSPSQLSQKLSGDLLSRFSADAAAVETAATYTLASYVRDGLQIAVLLAVALSLEWRLALATLAAIPIAILPASRLTRSLLRRVREAQGHLGDLAAHVQEGLSGLRAIQAYGGQSAEKARFESHARAHLRATTYAAWTRLAVPAVMEVLAALAIASAIAWAASSRELPPETLVSLLAALVLVYQPAKDLGRVSQFAVQAAASCERIFEILSLEEPVRDGPGARWAEPLKHGIRLESVAYSYPGGARALDGLTLEVPRGRVIALVGASGAGKSTVTSLLLRFEEPSGGRILIDGVDARELAAKSVRAQFALVTQEPLLFSTTVLENIRFGKPKAAFDEVVAAAKAADADGFIRALPQGYDTPLGERGVKLSGGQKQRICLARAVLADAPVLVLDEATSSLDPESEREVQRALTGLLKGRTALIIAHRLSTVAGADRIYVLDDGRVVESGTHEELLRSQGSYARLWALQNAPARAGAA